MKRNIAYILENEPSQTSATWAEWSQESDATEACFQVISANTGRYVSPIFSTLLEAIEFFDVLRDYEWNGHIEVRGQWQGDLHL